MCEKTTSERVSARDEESARRLVLRDRGVVEASIPDRELRRALLDQRRQRAPEAASGVLGVDEREPRQMPRVLGPQLRISDDVTGMLEDPPVRRQREARPRPHPPEEIAAECRVGSERCVGGGRQPDDGDGVSGLRPAQPIPDREAVCAGHAS
jgi:hypothetical protein